MLKILIADDEPYNILSLKMMLEKLNYQYIDECYNGEQCLEKISEKGIELMISWVGRRLWYNIFRCEHAIVRRNKDLLINSRYVQIKKSNDHSMHGLFRREDIERLVKLNLNSI